MKTPSPATVIATLALVVATTGTGIAATKINGKDIKNYSITENKLAKNSVSGRVIRPASITTTDLADGVIVNNTINAPQGDKGDPGQTVVGAPGAPGTPGQPGTPGTNAPHAWGIVHGDGSLGDSANLTVRKPAATTGIYCLSTAGYNHTNAIAVAQPWGSQLATPGYVGAGSDCTASEFQVDVLSPSSVLVDSVFSVVII